MASGPMDSGWQHRGRALEADELQSLGGRLHASRWRSYLSSELTFFAVSFRTFERILFFTTRIQFPRDLGLKCCR
jgi:hypothetical protein